MTLTNAAGRLKSLPRCTNGGGREALEFGGGRYWGVVRFGKLMSVWEEKPERYWLMPVERVVRLRIVEVEDLCSYEDAG